jgi:hypothetical protein
VSLICRHNRFTAECPICSKSPAVTGRQPRPRPAARRERRSSSAPAPAYQGPYAAVGPYEDEGQRYEVRLERVPGGLRLGEWQAGSLRKRAPVLVAADLPALVSQAAERELLPSVPDVRPGGSSPGRTGELRDELRVEPLEDDRVRIARWILRPNFGWELQEAPVMLPAARYVEALAAPAPA